MKKQQHSYNSTLRKVGKDGKKKQQRKEWQAVCYEERDKQVVEKGFIYCVLCGKVETPNHPVWGHHKDRNRNNNTNENCELDHWVCHQNMYHGGMLYNPFTRGEV